MKKELLFLILIFTYGMTLCQPTSILSENDTCSPIFKDIYDFQIGNVFQYVKKEWSSSGGAGYNDKITSKYTIINKSVNGDTLVYQITGIMKHEQYCDSPLPGCEYHSESSYINETLIFTDSTKHFINSCNNEIISNFIPEEYFWEDFKQLYGELYTKIQIQTEFGNPEKVIGGIDNLYIYNEQDSLVRTSDVQYNAVYAKNLGKTKEYFWYFEFSEDDYLQGYIKDGDTTGTISSDEDLLSSIANTRLEKDIIFYPNPTNGIIYFKSRELLSNGIEIEISDIRGNILLNQHLTNNRVDLTSFSKGIYFVIIKIENDIRIIKVAIQDY